MLVFPQKGRIIANLKKKTFKKPTEDKPPMLDKSGNMTTIYVGNLRFNKREEAVKKMFQRFGKVTYVRNVLDKKTGNNKGFSFVQMPYKEDAIRAINDLNGKVIDGRTLKVSIALENETDESRQEAEAFQKNIDKVRKKMTKKSAPKKKQKKGLDLLFDHINK